MLSSDNITHGFFGRNRQPDAAVYGEIIKLRQVHGAQCIKVLERWGDDRPEADAMVTDVAGLALGIVTADCAPVLFYGEKKCGAPVIGAAHAGWGGALKGVLENTVGAMEALGAVKDTLCAAIGPCIRQESYEVSDDFRLSFLEHDPASAAFFIPSKRDGYLMFDLPGYAARRLMLAGVPQNSDMGMDTYFNEMDYFSYRRSTHRNEDSSARQASVVYIK